MTEIDSADNTETCLINFAIFTNKSTICNWNHDFSVNVNLNKLYEEVNNPALYSRLLMVFCSWDYNDVMRRSSGSVAGWEPQDHVTSEKKEPLIRLGRVTFLTNGSVL